MKIKKTLFLIIFFGPALYAAYFSIYSYAHDLAYKLPYNAPMFCKEIKQVFPRVVILGDSITHGRVSFNYIDTLAEKFKGRLEFINAGVNSNLAYNALQRVNAVIDCNPSYAIILIGTNDVNATLDDSKKKKYIETMNLPREPEKGWYRDNLKEIIKTLRSKTNAKIAILSLPLIGEEVNSTANNRILEYNNIIKYLSDEMQLTYLPLYEKQIDYIKDKKITKDACESSDTLVIKAVAFHYLLGKSWDQISEMNGFNLTTDCLHFNGKGAGMISDLIGEFLSR